MPGKLRAGPRPVFTKTAVWARVRLQDAGGHADARGGRREVGPVDRGRAPVGAAEARGERAYALEPDGEADVRHAVVGVAQQLRGTLQPAGQQVLVRRLPERPPELAAEVRGREPGGL